MRENRRFSEMRRERMNEPQVRELHAKCVILGRSALPLVFTTQGVIRFNFKNTVSVTV